MGIGGLAPALKLAPVVCDLTAFEIADTRRFQGIRFNIIYQGTCGLPGAAHSCATVSHVCFSLLLYASSALTTPSRRHHPSPLCSGATQAVTRKVAKIGLDKSAVLRDSLEF